MSEHDPIETLLKASGPRPAVPAPRMERVREAAALQWRQELARRGRRRLMAWMASLAAAAAVVAGIGLGVRALRSGAVPELTGVRVERLAEAAWARADVRLQVGSVIPRDSDVTTAAGARAALRTPEGYSLRLDSDTVLRVLSDRAFVLRRGAVYVDSHGAGASHGTSIRIDTEVGTIEDRGTQFEARWQDATLSVRVREGVVTIQKAAGRLEARAGEALRLDASGRVDRTVTPASGEAWAWSEAIAPMMEIEGRSLREFLDWVARERGVTLRFADDGLAGKAPAIVLRGSVAGMTLDQATASVLQTCGLSHRFEGGALLIDAGPGAPRAP